MNDYILLSIEIPSADDREAFSLWKTLQPKLAHKAERNAAIKTLAPNVWLIDRDNGMPFVAEAVYLAENYSLCQKLLFLDEA